MLEITLVQPFRPKRTGNISEESWQLTRPFSLFFLAAALKKCGRFKVRIVDLETKKYKDQREEEIFKENHSQIFGITATTYTRYKAIEVAKLLKNMHVDSMVVVGGVHFSYCAEETLVDIPEIDVVVRGEGELTIVELAEAVDNNVAIDSISGITYRKNGKVISNPNRLEQINIDELDLYELYSIDDYPEYVYGYPEKIKAISVMTSRGCPYNCIFCAKQSTGYRVRNVKKVVDELEMLKEKYSIEGMNFIDLTLTANPSHIQDLCIEMIKRNLNLRWWCESRANMPLEFLDIMRKAGCVSCALGVESGSNEILKRLRKNITTDQVKLFCKKCKTLDIKVQCYFTYSHPDELEADVENTLDLIEELLEYASCYLQPVMVFPGTELEKIAREKEIIPKDFLWSDPFYSAINKEFNQLDNCPLYIDLLPLEFMKNVQSRSKKLVYERKIYKELSSYSLFEIFNQAIKYLFIEKRPIPSYVNISFLKKLLNNRILRKN